MLLVLVKVIAPSLSAVNVSAPLVEYMASDPLVPFNVPDVTVKVIVAAFVSHGTLKC